jgi:hypothetical protein
MLFEYWVFLLFGMLIATNVMIFGYLGYQHFVIDRRK